MEKTSGSAWRICGFFNMPCVYIYIRTLCHNFAEIYVPVSDLIKKNPVVFQFWSDLCAVSGS